jgi:hypothetical protein
MVLTRKLKRKFVLVFQLYVSWFGIAETLVFNRKDSTIFLQVIHLAAHSIQLWRFLSRKININAWLLGATAYWWLHMIFSASLLGGLLADCKMYRKSFTLFLFRWLILYQPYRSCVFVNFKFLVLF